MAKDPREYGYEGDMVISQLKSIVANAERLMTMLKPETDLPEWVQLKVTLAQDYISTASDYMESEMKESIDEIAVEKMNSHKRKYTEVSHNDKVLGRVYKTADSEFPYKTNRKKMGDRGISVSKMHRSKEDAIKHLMSTAKTNEAVSPAQQAAIAISMKKAGKKPKDQKDEACWSGYTAKGMKMKGGRMVPNCVPAEAVTTEKPPFEGPYKKVDKKPVTRSHLKSLTKAARDTISKSSQKKSK